MVLPALPPRSPLPGSGPQVMPLLPIGSSLPARVHPPGREEGARGGGGCHSGPAGLAWSRDGGRRRRRRLRESWGVWVMEAAGTLPSGTPPQPPGGCQHWRRLGCPTLAVASLKSVVKKVIIWKTFLLLQPKMHSRSQLLIGLGGGGGDPKQKPCAEG